MWLVLIVTTRASLSLCLHKFSIEQFSRETIGCKLFFTLSCSRIKERTTLQFQSNQSEARVISVTTACHVIYRLHIESINWLDV